MQIDRERLLKAAARFDSQSSGSDSASDSDSGSRGARKKSEHSSKHSKKRKSKHSSKKSHKSHEKHKRSDHEKIAELEKRAAAMGAGSMVPSMGRMGFGRYSGTATAASGDAVTLDTSGDANNALYESLYGGDLPRYNRMDPLDLVRVSRRLGGQLQGDADVGNTTADRYYRGRHYLQERNRSTKRINLSNLQPPQHSQTGSMGLKPHKSSSTLLLPPTTPLLPPGGKSGAAAATTSGGLAALQQQQQGGGSSSRRLAIPAPAFIPLEAPQELLQQQEGGATGDAGSWRQQQGQQGQQKAIEPTELVEQAGLSADELLLQATRAWNIAVRERPHDEALWLEFAAFQHSAAQQQQQRGRAATSGLLDPVTAEKQISLLSRGLVHHPSSTQLLLALLRCYAAVAPDADALEAKWAAVLARQGGSWELWREYIALRQCSFADFKVSGLQKVYQDALHSLQLELLSQRRRAAAAHREQRKQPPQLTQEQQQQLTPLGAAAAAAATVSSSGLGLGLPVTLHEEALELQLVQLLLGLLYVGFEAGYTEQALAKMQALLEFHLFPPQMPPGGIPALLRLFAAYWSAGVPRIGEAGARGWAYWCLWHAMGMEQPSAAPAAAEEQAAAEAAAEAAAAGPQQPDPAGWSGWFEVPQAAGPAKPAGDSSAAAAAAAAAAGGQGSGDANADAVGMSHQGAQQESGAEGDGHSEGSETGSEEGQAAAASEDVEVVEELDEEELMQQLGLQLEQQLQEVERQGLPADVLARWVQEEAASCACKWQPLRRDCTKITATSPPEPQPDAASPPDPARVATLDSIQPHLFLLRSSTALRRLVLGCVELLGVRMGPVPWCSSNCPTPWQQQASHAPGGSAVSGLGSSSNDSSSKGSCWSDAAAQGAGIAGSMQQQQQWQQQQCQQVPWYAASDERWQWAVNVLQRLAAGGPCGDWPELCQALMLILASRPSDAAATTTGVGAVGAACDGASMQDSHAGQHAAGGGLKPLTLDGAAAAAAAAGTAGLGDRPSQQQLSTARAAAKQLLSDQQENLLLYDAYGCLEAAAGQVKTARKVFETALALATTAAAGPAAGTSAQDRTPAAAAEAAARLAVHLAQLEVTSGGAGGWVKAHVALHALLTRQQLQVSAAAEAAGISSSQGQQQQQQQQGGGLLAEAQLRAARVTFQQQIPGLISSAGGFLTPTAGSTIAAAALFELVVGLRRGDAAAGLDAAVAVCKQVSAAVPEAVRATSTQHEQLAVLQCHMLVAAATGSIKPLAPGLSLQDSSKGGGASAGRSTASSSMDSALAASLAAAVPPARAREGLAAALQLYPQSNTLLQLQVALDHACLTLSGLRRQLAALLEMNPSPWLWAVALQAEALRPGGRVRLGVLFERALAAPTALQWHQQERLQRQRNTRAWDAACANLAPPPRQQVQQEGQGRAQQQRQQLLQQPVTSQGRAAVLQDLAVWDGYRGWGHCEAGLWQQYIQHELGLGRLDAARKLFLRAVHAMPGAKGLWLSGFGAVCAGMQPRECSGLLNVMQEREVMVRTDVYEVLLAAMAEKQQMQLG